MVDFWRLPRQALCFCLAILLLSACQGGAGPQAKPASPVPASTAGPSAMPRATPQRPADLGLAKDKRPARMFPGRLVYQVPGMDRALLTNQPYKGKYTADIYYPPDHDFADPLPVVVFVNGFAYDSFAEPLKDTEQYISWGELVAASGMAAVTYDAHTPDADILDLLRYIAENAGRLGLDPTRMLLWSCSRNVPTAIRTLVDAPAEDLQHLRGVVFYYGQMWSEPHLPKDIPLLVAKAGNDTRIDKSKIDEFVATARAQGVAVEYLEHPQGVHAFDTAQDDETSREIIRQTLAFMQARLLKP